MAIEYHEYLLKRHVEVLALQKLNQFDSIVDLFNWSFGVRSKAQQKFLMFSALISARITFIAMSKFTILIMSRHP